MPFSKMADHFDEKSGVVPSKTPWGSWAQTIDEVFIEVHVPKGTKGREIICEIRPKSIKFILKGKEVFKASCNFIEALLGVIGIRDIWVKNYRDTGYLGGKLKGYGIFLKRFWDIEVIIF